MEWIMKKLCQIAVYELEILKYLEDLNLNKQIELPFELPCIVQCEVLEFASQEDCDNLRNLVSLENINVSTSTAGRFSYNIYLLGH